MLMYHLFRKNCADLDGVASFHSIINSDYYMNLNHKEHFLGWNLIVSKSQLQSRLSK